MVHDSMSLCCVLCLMFWYFVHFLFSLQCSPLCTFLHILSSDFSPPSLLVCPPLSVSIVSLMLFLPCLSLIISPVLLPPLSPPVPRALISVSVYLSLCSPCTLCQFIVGVWVMSPSRSWCFPLCLQSFWYVLDFDLNFAFLRLHFVCCFCCYFVFWSLDSFHLFPWFVYSFRFEQLKLAIWSFLSCLSWVCIWVYLKSTPVGDNWLA